MVALSLAGCGSTVPDGVATTDYQLPPAQVLHVETKNDTHVVYLDRRTGAAAPSERLRLDAFVKAFGDNRPDAIHAELHGPGSTAQLQTVADMLVARGVERSKITLYPAEPAAKQAPPGTYPVTISAMRGFVVAPNCPAWGSPTAAPQDNRTSPTLGCTDAGNLAAMVADPYDLTRGSGNPLSDGQRAAAAAAAYRGDRVKSLPSSSTQSVTSAAPTSAGGSNVSTGAGTQ